MKHRRTSAIAAVLIAAALLTAVPASAQGDDPDFSGLLSDPGISLPSNEAIVTRLDHGLGDVTVEELAAASLLTEDDLDIADERLVAIVTTPAKSVSKITAVPTSAPHAKGANRWLRNGSIPSYGCWWLTVSKAKKNLLGWTLYSAEQHLRNVCRSGSTFSPDPTSQRRYTAAWGWTHCGWNAEYAGWVSGNSVFGAGGQARFALGGLCWATTGIIGVEIEADAVAGWWSSWAW